MAKNNKMPVIRFSGYTNVWEQRKFLDLLDAQNGIRRGPFGSSLKKDSFVKKSDYVVYEQQNAIYDNYETRYFISKEKYNELIRFNIQPGDFIMSGAGTIGRISMVPDGIKKGVFNQALIRFKVNKDSINPLYFLKFMQSDMMQKQLTQANPGSAMTNLVPMDELKKWDVIIPSLEEQNRISTFINQMDAFITLHQRKLEKLKLTKKALLQKLFPQNGSKLPELRFKGFTDAWEQCKLSDITEVIMGQSPSSKNYTDNPNDDILVQGNADLKDGKVVPRLWTKEITKTIDKGGIILTVRAPVGDVAKTDYKVVLGRGVAGIKGNDYIYQFLQKLQYNRYWVSLSSGSTFESINSNDIKDLIIDIPSIEEQTKISMLLNNVNSIITLHHRKLEMLKNVKKGLLQKMFV